MTHEDANEHDINHETARGLKFSGHPTLSQSIDFHLVIRPDLDGHCDLHLVIDIAQLKLKLELFSCGLSIYAMRSPSQALRLVGQMHMSAGCLPPALALITPRGSNRRKSKWRLRKWPFAAAHV